MSTKKKRQSTESKECNITKLPHQLIKYIANFFINEQTKIIDKCLVIMRSVFRHLNFYGEHIMAKLPDWRYGRHNTSLISEMKLRYYLCKYAKKYIDIRVLAFHMNLEIESNLMTTELRYTISPDKHSSQDKDWKIGWDQFIDKWYSDSYSENCVASFIDKTEFDKLDSQIKVKVFSMSYEKAPVCAYGHTEIVSTILINTSQMIFAHSGMRIIFDRESFPFLEYASSFTQVRLKAYKNHITYTINRPDLWINRFKWLVNNKENVKIFGGDLGYEAHNHD